MADDVDDFCFKVVVLAVVVAVDKILGSLPRFVFFAIVSSGRDWKEEATLT